MIRAATMEDRPALTQSAIKWARAAHPYLRHDVAKISEALGAAIRDKKHFCWVSVEDGVLNGALVGLTGDNLWAQRGHCSIQLLWSNGKAAGAALLRRFRMWLGGTRSIAVAGYSDDNEAIWDRGRKLFEAMGFRRVGGAYLRYNNNVAHY